MAERFRKRFPPWLKRRIGPGAPPHTVKNLLADMGLATVCQNALCPNLGECFGRGTAAFLIMGNTCTRNCRFCAVAKGTPQPLDAGEPARVALAVRALGLKHVVLTSVTRDDLPDGGAAHFVLTVRSIRDTCGASVELLTPDFMGARASILAVASCAPEIFNHNVETVHRLYPSVRPGADYRRSLGLLRMVKDSFAKILTKSGFMLGLGETAQEVRSLLGDLRAAGCDIVTIGQYLQPGARHLPVERYIHPDEFDQYRATAEEMGFLGVASGPYVRSSHNADRILEEVTGRLRRTGRARAGQ